MAKPKPIPDDLYDSDEPPPDLFGDEEESAPVSPKVSPSFLDSISSYIPNSVKSGWDTANKSLFDYAPDWMNPSKRVAARHAEENAGHDTTKDWDIPFTGGAKWSGLRQGVEQGSADVVSGLASPLNIATTAATMGAGPTLEAGLPSAARGLHLAGRALSAPVAAHGAYEMVRPDATWGERGMGLTEFAGGAAGTIAPMPIKKGSVRSITPEIQKSLGELTTQRLLELEHSANERVKNTPNEIDKRKSAGLPAQAPRKEPTILDTLQEQEQTSPSREESSISRIEQEIPPDMMESFSTVDDGQSPNASGESAASGEALSRQEGMRSRGESYIVYNKAGVARNLIGPEAVDYQAKPGETYGIKTPRGFVQLHNNGGNVPPQIKTLKKSAPKEYPGFKGRKGSVGDASGLRGRLDAATDKPVIDVGETALETTTPDDFSDIDPFQQRQEDMRADSERMREENARPRPIEEQDANAEWDRRQRETAIYEGRNINDVHTPLDPKQQQVSDSYNKIREHSDAYAEEFSRMEEQLPEGEIYKPPPEVRAKYEAEQAQLKDAHNKLVKKLYPRREKAKLATIDAEFTTGEPSSQSGNKLGEYQQYRQSEIAAGRKPMDYNTYEQKALPKPGDTGTSNDTGGPREGRRQTATASNEPPIPPKRTAAEYGPEDFGKEIKPLADVIEDAKALPKGPEKDGIIRKTNSAMRSLLTTWDLSAPGRQGKAFLLNKAYWTSLDDMVRAWGSEEAAHKINESITEHPSGYFKQGVSESGRPEPSFAEKSGLDLAPNEEAFKGTFGDKLKKYSGINKAGRAHTAFLNKLRSDQFVAFMEDSKKAGRSGEDHPLIAQQFAKFINDGTGRGSLNIGKWKLERNAGALSDVFFAPKNMSGQIRTWNSILNPYRYYQADPIMRKQALKSLFAVSGMGMAAGELGKLVGGEVSNDPTSTDFRKIVIGDTRIDFFGGYQQFPVAAMRLLAGKTTSPSGKSIDLTAGKFGMPTRASTAERFFTNRLAPLPAFVWAWMSNREFDGKPFEIKKGLYERTLPIAMEDMIKLAQEDPKLAAILSPFLMTGMAGTQTYTRE